MNTLKFDNKKHKYSVNGVEYHGVTTLVSSYFPKFDDKAIAKKLASFPINKLNKRGVRYWLKKWKLQQEYGSLIHNLMDMYVQSNYKYTDTISDKDEYTTACTWLDSKLRSMNEPLCWSELRVQNNKYRLAGTVDLLISENDGSTNNRVHTLVDWKVTKEISKENKYDKSINKLGFANANYWKYALQLNMYAWILSQEGYEITEMILVHLQGDSFVEYHIPVMFDKIGEILGDLNEKSK